MGGPLSAVGVIQNDPGQLEGSKPILKTGNDFPGSSSLALCGYETKEGGYIPDIDMTGGYQD